MLGFNIERSRRKHLQWVILWTLFGIRNRISATWNSAKWKGTIYSIYFLPTLAVSVHRMSLWLQQLSWRHCWRWVVNSGDETYVIISVHGWLAVQIKTVCCVYLRLACMALVFPGQCISAWLAWSIHSWWIVERRCCKEFPSARFVAHIRHY